MATSIPEKCRAVVIEGPNAPWAIKEVPVPQPAPNEVLVKVLACGVCHSDVVLQKGLFGPLASFPRIPGHEVIGKVVKVGDRVEGFEIGDKVGGPWHGGHDGRCKACNRGLFQMCENGLVNGVSRNGGYAEYCTLRAEATVRIPPEADAAEYAPLLCAGVTVFNSMRNMKITPGDVCAVQGLGGLGHLALQYARKMGFKTVALSSSDAKREFAFQLGANEYIDTSKEDAAEALQKMGGASLVVVTAPNPKLMSPLVKACGPLGKLLLLAPVGEVPVDTVAMTGKGISVHGWPSGHALDSEEAISFAQNQGVKCMVEKFPLDKVEEAVQRMNDNKVRFRSVLVME
ncbi:alcohol dehydrogenase [Westerdykella ornata]|uniref:Alcohol dehydrogenase n=1 Tax=Westerdykella ornata TaxID=318751 RepID=A0A6A6JKP7_WESOR|nr:alcohol dehydrogenase [Westerdykella ornata]KAF2276805.1 alcohol dehydrogenase [Westerdykella ornata]